MYSTKWSGFLAFDRDSSLVGASAFQSRRNSAVNVQDAPAPQAVLDVYPTGSIPNHTATLVGWNIWGLKRGMNTKKTLRIAIVLLIVAAVATALAVLPVKDNQAGFLERIESVGPWGPVLLAGAYAIACVLFVPGSILTLGAGFLFGVGWGTVAVSAGSVLGATAAFLIGRTLLRGWIEARIASYPRFQAIDRARTDPTSVPCFVCEMRFGVACPKLLHSLRMR